VGQPAEEGRRMYTIQSIPLDIACIERCPVEPAITGSSDLAEGCRGLRVYNTDKTNNLHTDKATDN